MRKGILSGVLGLALLAASPVAASTVKFRITSTCLTECFYMGIPANEGLLGFLTLSTAGFAAGAAVTKSDVTNFSLFFGTTPVLIAYGVSPAFDFAASWGATSGSVEDVRFVASGADSLLSPGPYVSFSPTTNVGSLDVACEDVNCAKVMAGDLATLSPLSVTEPTFLAPVPLPPAAALLGTGVLGLVAAARRRPRPARAAGAAQA